MTKDEWMHLTMGLVRTGKTPEEAIEQADERLRAALERKKRIQAAYPVLRAAADKRFPPK